MTEQERRDLVSRLESLRDWLTHHGGEAFEAGEAVRWQACKLLARTAWEAACVLDDGPVPPDPEQESRWARHVAWMRVQVAAETERAEVAEAEVARLRELLGRRRGFVTLRWLLMAGRPEHLSESMAGDLLQWADDIEAALAAAEAPTDG